MAFKKIDKQFVLSDSSVNVYGFKLMTPGYQLAEFAKNPIGYYGHDSKDGVLVRWEDLKLDGDRIVGTPVINMEHPRAARTVQEIEEGFLNSASVGKIHVVKYHLEDNADDPENPTLVADVWYNKECSLVDNPGNRNAMKVALCDSDGNEVTLADLKSVLNKNRNMKKFELPCNSAELVRLLNLDDDATGETVLAGIRNLADENTRLTAENAQLKTEKTELEAAGLKKEVKALLDKGLADGKFNAKTSAELELTYAGNPTGLKKLIDGMGAYVPLSERIAGTLPANLRDLADKTYDDLDKAGKLELLKKEAPELYVEKYEIKFGKRPKA
jgi:hypothetical protein